MAKVCGSCVKRDATILDKMCEECFGYIYGPGELKRQKIKMEIEEEKKSKKS